MNAYPTLHAPYQPSSDQLRAIDALVRAATNNARTTLLGVTGSGKTFVMANVAARLCLPVLVLSHNKTLAAQLYQEFHEFFPDGDVHYFVSYYDYYQPEAYLPATDTYIEKDAKINDVIDQLRHAATAAVLSAPYPIVVASVSAIYGLGSPAEYLAMSLEVIRGTRVGRNTLLSHLTDLQYHRNDAAALPGTFSVRGEIVEIVSPDGTRTTRIVFFGDDIESLAVRAQGITEEKRGTPHERVRIFPAKHFVTPQTTLRGAITSIETEMKKQLERLKRAGNILEAERLRQRTQLDLAMLRETGYCSGIENYSRHIEQRAPGSPPSTLIDYFPDQFITFIDESHITIPQIRGMHNGDRARKQVLVEHGFRLPSALDNRPLTFAEFDARARKQIYVSATPGIHEHETSAQTIELLTRPTGLLDPDIRVEATARQVARTIALAAEAREKGERSLVVCLTKRNAEDIAAYLTEHGIRTAWIHADIKTLERPQILSDLRSGTYDVLVGINLLREGIDLPEVALVCILDADKEGFLRNATTLIQTIGRASRHLSGRVVFFADRMTDAMQTAIDETQRRRAYQEQYNAAHNITPHALPSRLRPALFAGHNTKKVRSTPAQILAEKQPHALSRAALAHELEQEMLAAAADLDFERAAALRDALGKLNNATS